MQAGTNPDLRVDGAVHAGCEILSGLSCHQEFTDEQDVSVHWEAAVLHLIKKTCDSAVDHPWPSGSTASLPQRSRTAGNPLPVFTARKE